MRQKAQSEIEGIVSNISDIPSENIKHYSYEEAYESSFDSSVVTVISMDSNESMKSLISTFIDKEYDINREDTTLYVMINHTVSQRFNPSGNIE